MSLEKIEILKNKIHVYKKKMNAVSSCTIDVKKKVVSSQHDSKLSLNKNKREVIVDNSFIPEELKSITSPKSSTEN